MRITEKRFFFFVKVLFDYKNKHNTLFFSLLHLADLILHRDEALSSIISVETFDLALSVDQMHIEEEFGGTGMFSMFSKRISSQISQLIVKKEKTMKKYLIFFVFLVFKGFVNHWINFFAHGNRNEDFTEKQAALVRDEFNLNKILIVVTSVGKVNSCSIKNLVVESFSLFRFSEFSHKTAESYGNIIS